MVGGNIDTAVHTAFGKLCVSLDMDPARFLKSNEYFDPRGKPLIVWTGCVSGQCQ